MQDRINTLEYHSKVIYSPNRTRKRSLKAKYLHASVDKFKSCVRADAVMMTNYKRSVVASTI